MACFIAPATEAIVATAVQKKLEANQPAVANKNSALSWSKRLKWLSTMLWGGSALLMLEHIWHGEVVLYPPFLSALSNPQDTAEMLHEIATVGVGMAVLVTATWAIACVVIEHVPQLKAALVDSEA